MIPATLSAIGVSLSEFADSMVVANLLNSGAFAVVNLATPIVFMVTMVYTITGLGGSLLFAECLGKKESEKASNYFTISSAIAVLTGVLLTVLLIALHPFIGNLFGCPDELRAQFDLYVRVLCLFVPVGILFMHLTPFLPIIGRPYLSMGLVIAANVLNIVLDFVFIRVFGMGCEGAAAATLVSYILAFVAMLLILRFGRISLKICKASNIWKSTGEIVAKGIPAGAVQAGFVVTTVFCNHHMNLAFALSGVVTMSLFGQLDSFISIALSGIGDNNASFVAMLKGEGDYYGIRDLSKRVIVMVVGACTVMSIVFGLFPEQLAAIFNIHDRATLELIKSLIWIYVLYYPLRAIILVLRDIYNALGRSLYATVLGILDKVVCIPLIGSILYALFGGYGLIAAFPTGAALILCLIAVVNHRIVRKSNGRYSPVLLLDEEYPLKVIGSYSVASLEDPSDIGEYLGKSLAEASADRSLSNKICLAAEEMGIYIAEHCGSDTAVDFLISYNGSEYILTCRSPGKPFCPFNVDKEDMSLNEKLLTGMFKVKHEYVFGLNSTSLTIGA